MTVRRAGVRGRLVEHDAPATLRAAVLATDRDGIVEDCVPAARTLLVTVRDDVPPARLDELIAAALAAPAPPLQRLAARTVTIDVVYDGEDLPAVAAATGLTVEQVIGAHSGTVHRVAFFGFAPGLAYLDGVPEALRLPRRDTPRLRVAAGAVAIAGAQSLVYPGGTPGGWHLIGRTDARLWDLAAVPPNRLEPDDAVVFRRIP